MTPKRRRETAAGLIALGVALRLWEYIARGTLWLDEAAVARNVAARSWSGILRPLDFAQIAPKGFLLFEKLAVTLLGPSEKALRLYALVTALAALPVFYALARRALDERGALIALAFFAVLGRPIYYGAEAKQYGGDIFWAALLLLLARRVLVSDAAPRHWLRLGVLGAIAVWFSQPALFVLAGIGIALAVAVVFRQIPLRWPAVVACVLWAASGIPSILATLGSLAPAEQRYMHSFWSAGFWPLPPRSWGELLWPLENLYGLFRDPLGMPVTALGVGLFLLGCIVLARRKPVALSALVAPLGILYLAAALRIYPFDTTLEGFNKIAAGNGRLLLFLLPSLILLVTEGIVALLDTPLRRVRVVGAGAAALVIGAPLFYDAAGLPYTPQDLRPAFHAIATDARPGDALYVAYGARQAFTWYRARVPLPDSAITLGGCYRTGWREYMREVDAFRGRGRLWVLVSHPAAIHGLREMVLLEDYLDRVATKLGRWGGKDAYVLLYDMSRSARPPGPPAAWHPPPRALAGADTITVGWSCTGVFPGPGIPGTVYGP